MTVATWRHLSDMMTITTGTTAFNNITMLELQGLSGVTQDMFVEC